MSFFKPNVLLRPYRPTSPWRKIALGTWNNSGDPTVYAFIEVDCTSILKTIEEYKQKEIKITPTIIVAKGLAMSLQKCPQLNGLIRFGRLYLRQTVDMFLQVAAADANNDNLSGTVIRQFDKKSLTELAQELHQRSHKIKNENKEEFQQVKKMLNWVPGILMRPLLSFLSFLQYDLNWWSKSFGSPRDGFGSAMITSVGMMGIENALVPLIPHYRCPLLMCLGKICDRPVVRDGQVVVRPMMTVGVTFDHRFIDGMMGSKMLKILCDYLQNPE